MALVTMGDRQVSKDQAEELLVYGLRTAEKAVDDWLESR